MLNRLIAFAFVAFVAIGGGTAMTYYSMRGADHFGSVTLGGWTAFPPAGTPEADPYSKAMLARDAALALGIAEGITFFLDRDPSGDPFLGRCDYIIEGLAPPARFWTFNIVDIRHRPLSIKNAELPAMLHSGSIVYEPDNTIRLRLSALARPGNWIATPTEQNFALAMTLYDSPIASNKGLIDTAFPSVRKAGCRG